MFSASLFIPYGQHADAANHPFVLSERNVDQRIARLQNASQRKRVTTVRGFLHQLTYCDSWFSLLFPLRLNLIVAGPEEGEESSEGEILRPIQFRLI